MFIFDAVTLGFSFVNDGAVRMVGYQRDELLRMSPLHLNPYTTESEYRRLVDALIADGSSSMVRRSTLLTKDGSEVPVEKIARDLHDTVIQRLVAEGLSLQSAMAGVGDPQQTRTARVGRRWSR